MKTPLAAPLLLTACCLAAPAAIITERNDILCYPPPAYTFAGTSSRPGIESCWIPYGTYADGTGGTEYTRITSNLMGVVISAFDGMRERERPETAGWEGHPDRWILYYPWTTQVFPSGGWDHGELFESLTTNTTRIVDFLNAHRFVGFWVENETNYYYSTSESCTLEELLSRTEWDWDGGWDARFYVQYHSGFAADYGGRRLDSMVPALEPPIGSTWTATRPFLPSASNEWAKVWPTYAALTNDIHFFPDYPDTNHVYRSEFRRMHLREWLMPGHLDSLWGDDISGWTQTYPYYNQDGAKYLYETLRFTPLPYTMEDVLSADTGWKYEVPPVCTGDIWAVEGQRLDHKEQIFNAVYWTSSNPPSDTNVPTYRVTFLIYEEPPGEVATGTWDAWVLDPSSGEWENIGSESGSEDDETLSIAGLSISREYRYSNADDYTHWRNNSTRLDWKRLGIICQLERQMEQSYRPLTGEDYLPYVYVWAYRTMEWGALLPLDGSVPSTIGYEREYSLYDVGWNFETNMVLITTNSTEWSFPTARAGKPSFGGRIDGSGVSHGWDFSSSYEVKFTKDEFQSMVQESLDLAGPVIESHSDCYFDCDLSIAVSENPINISIEFKNCYLFYTLEPGDPGYDPDNPKSESVVLPSPSPRYCTIDNATNLVASIGRSISKNVDGLWTHATRADERDIYGRFDHFPVTNAWAAGLVKRQTRPTLEVMMSTHGDGAAALVGNVEPLRWNDLVNMYLSRSERLFRMNPLAAAQESLSTSDYNRLEMLRSLDEDVKNKFAAIYGASVVNVEGRSELTANEQGVIADNLAAKKIKATFRVEPWGFINHVREDWFDPEQGYSPIEEYETYYGWDALSSASLGIDATLSVTRGGYGLVINNFAPYSIYSGDWVWAQYADSSGAFTVAEAFWMISEVNSDAEVSSGKEPTVVDGHQDQMIKTLWKFKNLRDPNL